MQFNAEIIAEEKRAKNVQTRTHIVILNSYDEHNLEFGVNTIDNRWHWTQ